jgi:sulfite reductase alpha subunit-like flavoprotein
MDGKNAAARSVPPPLFPLQQTALQVPRTDVVVLVNACFGQGEPTDSAKPFYREVMSPSLAGAKSGSLRYAVFGLGNSRTHAAHYNVVARRLDERLGGGGMLRVVPLGLGDDGNGTLADDFEQWAQGLKEALTQLAALPDDAVASDVASSDNSTPSVAAPPVPATTAAVGDVRSLEEAAAMAQGLTTKLTVVERKLLTRQDERPCYQLRLHASSGQMTYEAGDHLVIFPASRAAGEALCALLQTSPNRAYGDTAQLRTLFGADAEGGVRLALDKVTALDVAASLVEPSTPPPPRALRAMADWCADATEAEHMRQVSQRGEPYESYARRPMRSLADVVQEHPSLIAGGLTLERLVGLMPPVRPRTYSIASAPCASGPDNVDIAIRRFSFQRPSGQIRPGHCSTFLSSTRTGDVLMAAARPAPTFRLPAHQPNAPIVMVGGGIGVAPMKGFLEELMAPHSRRPPAMLIRCFRTADDCIYDDLVAAALRSGALGTSITALETLPPVDATTLLPGLVVQGRAREAILAEAPSLLRLVESGAHIYVCGGASGFGFAVSRAIEQALRPSYNASDVFPSSSPTIGNDGPTCRGAPPDGAVAGLLAAERFHEDLAD